MYGSICLCPSRLLILQRVFNFPPIPFHACLLSSRLVYPFILTSLCLFFMLLKALPLSLSYLQIHIQTDNTTAGGDMKYWKILKQQIEETLPEWREKFLRYKDFKKLVRLIAESLPNLDIVKSHEEFENLLIVEMDRFNAFFEEKEEDYIIHHKELQHRIQELNFTLGSHGSHPLESYYLVEKEKIKEDMINFHGEMVLLLNYSIVNYTGISKILKKYDKRTGGSLRLLLIPKVVQQPFFTTNILSKLIKECENTIEVEFPSTRKIEEKRNDEVENMITTTVVGESILRSTVAALVTVQEMRKGSSTYSQYSLPPIPPLTDPDLCMIPPT